MIIRIAVEQPYKNRSISHCNSIMTYAMTNVNDVVEEISCVVLDGNPAGITIKRVPEP